MKKLVFTLLMAVFAISLSAQQKTIRVLAIGNSFSIDGMHYLWNVLNDVGYTDIYLGNLYIGGCTLETHAKNVGENLGAYTYYTNTNGTWNQKSNYAIKTALTSQEWDVVTMQQASGFSGVESSYEPYLSVVVDSVKKFCPGAKLMWHETWAYEQSSTHADFPKYDNDQMTMFNAILNAFQTQILDNKNFSGVIPSGTTI